MFFPYVCQTDFFQISCERCVVVVVVWSNNLWLKTLIFAVEPKLEAINIIHYIYIYLYTSFLPCFAEVSAISRLTFIWGVSLSNIKQRILPKL